MCVCVCVVVVVVFEYFGQSFLCLELGFSALITKAKEIRVSYQKYVSSNGVDPFQEPTDYLFSITAV